MSFFNMFRKNTGDNTEDVANDTYNDEDIMEEDTITPNQTVDEYTISITPMMDGTDSDYDDETDDSLMYNAIDEAFDPNVEHEDKSPGMSDKITHYHEQPASTRNDLDSIVHTVTRTPEEEFAAIDKTTESNPSNHGIDPTTGHDVLHDLAYFTTERTHDDVNDVVQHVCDVLNPYCRVVSVDTRNNNDGYRVEAITMNSNALIAEIDENVAAAVIIAQDGQCKTITFDPTNDEEITRIFTNQ